MEAETKQKIDVIERDGKKYVKFRGFEHEWAPSHKFRDHRNEEVLLMKIEPEMQTVNGVPRLLKPGGWVDGDGHERRKFKSTPVQLDHRPAQVLTRPVRSDIAASFELRHAAFILATTIKTGAGLPRRMVEEPGTSTIAVLHDDGTVTITIAGEKTRVKLPDRIAFERVEE